MHVLLKNAYITAKVNSLGAELCSLQGEKSKREYLWNGNPEYWNRCSPILFPFVGRLHENRYPLHADGRLHQLLKLCHRTPGKHPVMARRQRGQHPRRVRQRRRMGVE